MGKGPKSDLAPFPPPSAQLVSLASEVQDLHLAQRKEMTSGFNKGPTLGLLPDVPSLMETLSYSYCYVGIMTGEWACPTALSLCRPECLFCVPALPGATSILASAAVRVSLCLGLCLTPLLDQSCFGVEAACSQPK